MKKIFVAFLLFRAGIFAQQYPAATGYVNDFAKILSQGEGLVLNDELVAFEKKTSIEIAIVTVPWLHGQSIEDYTRGLAKEWGVGKRNQNNGVVFLIAPNERKMRIETASGIRSVLTDDRANKIRDEVVLPDFKDGYMYLGIIDGARAIMRVLDPISWPTAPTDSSTSSQTQTWTSEDTKIVEYGFIGVACVALFLWVILPRIWNSSARKYVLANKGKLAKKFADAERTASTSDVKEETRKTLMKQKSEFSKINRLTADDRGIKWVDIRDQLDVMRHPLGVIVDIMNDEIRFAEKARKEGPKLMQEIPDMIKDTEKKLAEGEPSKKALKHLENARSLYAQARRQQSGMTTMDWVILYMLLNNSQSQCANATSAHDHTNSSRSSDWSTSSSSPSSPTESLGFGGSGGFGGGGGFDGGGSSGSW